MKNQSRLLLFALLSFAIVFGSDYLFRKLGIVKPPPPRQAAKKTEAPKAGEAPKVAEAKAPADEPGPARPEPTTPSQIEVVDANLLVLGDDPGAPPAGEALPLFRLTDGEKVPARDRYWLRVGLDQRGGALAWVQSTYIEAESTGRGKPGLFQFIRPNVKEPPSLTLGFARSKADTGKADPLDAQPDGRLWGVERDDKGGVVHVLPQVDGKTGPGQEVRFRAELDEGVVVRRRYQLWPGEDTVRMTLEFQANEERTFAYRMLGPHDVPIEGIWYTSTFRDVFVGEASGENGATVKTMSAYDVVKNQNDPWRFLQNPVRFVGVEDQYFAVMLLPPSRADAERWIAEARTTVVSVDPVDKQHSNVTVDLLSKPISIGPNRPATHEFTIFTGPKTVRALPPVAAELATYRKGRWPLIGDLAAFLAQSVITPLLGLIQGALTAIGRPLGATAGNWGIAIVLLTMTVRLLMFPISRKQAVMAKRMQDLQPEINALREKYQDDKETLTKEQFALWSKHKVNPLGGCLPALLQLPIFIGLWQALNNSVPLRHASFLWIQDLAAPDMLFKFPFDMPSVPWIGYMIGPYFNLLPIIVAGLMWFHTKLFAPPATTPEAEMQQKMMKYMMIFMVFMFYKVPSGLGIYFITSSLWQLGERLLLPKVLPSTVKAPVTKTESEKDGADGGNGAGGGGWFAQKIEKLLDEASKDPTVRNRMQALEEARKQAPERGGGNGPPPPGRGKPRGRQGKKR